MASHALQCLSIPVSVTYTTLKHKQVMSVMLTHHSTGQQAQQDRDQPMHEHTQSTCKCAVMDGSQALTEILV